MLTLGNAPYRLQCDQFVASRLSIFTALLREQWTGVMPSEGINRLLEGLASFVSLSMQRKV